MIAKDLKSREVWSYDDQASIPMDYDIAVYNPSDAASTSMIQGVEVKPGDKIQATCVYDSTDRTESTVFGSPTYDEMCLITLYVTFETPKVLLESSAGEEDGASSTADMVNILADLQLRKFSCDVDDESHTTDVYQGFLTDTEDARNIWFEHPIEESDMCTFPVMNSAFEDGFMTYEVRNCQGGDVQVDGAELCRGISSSNNVEFLEDGIAGHTCVGGTYDMITSHEDANLTEQVCLENGGSFFSTNTCSDIERWLLYDAKAQPELTDEYVEFVRTEWFRPICCIQHDDALSSSAPHNGSTHGTVLAFLKATAIIVAMITI